MESKKQYNLLKQHSFNEPSLKRLPRQSQPTVAIESILSNVARIKQQHEFRKGKKKKQPRLSEIDVPHASTIGFSPSRFEDMRGHGAHGFLSPSSTNQQRFLKKCTSSSVICNQILSPRGFHRGELHKGESKQRKLLQKQKKDSLNMIQQMITNHIGANNGSKKAKPVKSPRYSEPLLVENQFNFMKRKKENQSMGRNNKESQGNDKKKKFEYLTGPSNDPREKQLKETVSTLSSLNANKLSSFSQLKITDFQYIKDLGKGKFGSVKLALHKKTGMIFSIKRIKKSVIKEQNIAEQMLNEIKLQAFINHSHIVKLYTIFHDKLYVYLVLEACTQGNLYQYMQVKGKLSEDETSIILKSICQAIAQLHQYQIIHRDLKPENIVLCYNMPKLCDFGWSAFLNDSMRETFCGTPLYVSPQLLSGQLYDEKVDLWALGILGYEMMTGTIPFKIKSEKDLCRIIDSEIKYPSWMSKSAVQCLRAMLEKDPKKRKGVEQILDHAFFHQRKSNEKI